MSEGLQDALLRAHAKDDRGELVILYLRAADQAESGQNVEKACFFLTHAWIFALETDHEMAGALHDRLQRLGRV